MWPERVAVQEVSGAALTYSELDRASDRWAGQLREAGVRAGDRVGIRMSKSMAALVALYAVLKAGASYVPVDPSDPRAIAILDCCRVRLTIVDALYGAGAPVDLAGSGCLAAPIADSRDGVARADLEIKGRPTETADAAPQGVNRACILHTSGSTGTPKGVELSHGNILSFVDWAFRVFQPEAEECFSSHAPFFFDLSILDLFLPVRSGACVLLIDDPLKRNPRRLASAIETSGVTSWYSTPTALDILIRYGRLLERALPQLRRIVFAGEPMSMRRLQELRDTFSQVRLLNLYGPTETNVCTYYEVPADLGMMSNQTACPIGRPCDHVAARIVTEAGEPAAPGERGELCISGPNVMPGYWQDPARTEAVFLDPQRRWYRTGDIVFENGAGDLMLLGRRDRMVKRHGYRIEPGEIEAALRQCDGICQAVVTQRETDSGPALVAHYTTLAKSTLTDRALRDFCAARLPVFLLPDFFVKHRALPTTATDKIDYVALSEVTA